MIIAHEGKTPSIHPTAWVAADATVYGDVVIGAHTRVLFGARVIAEGGRIEIGHHGIVMENAVVRSTALDWTSDPCRLKSRLSAGATVPIGWVAVGDPLVILPPDRHDAIWARQMPLNFPLEVYGFSREEADMIKITSRLSEAWASHEKDEVVG